MTIRLRSLLPLLCLAAPGVHADDAIGDAGTAFEHGDWTLACDNTGTCRAAGYPDGDDADPSTLSLLLTRKAGPGQAFAGAVKLDPESADLPALPPGPLHLRIDGQDLGAIGRRDEDGARALTPVQIRAVLASLLQPRGRVALIDAGHTAWPLSGKGAAAVLLKMDDVQGRLGTVGAAARKGDKPESSVPAALPVPQVRRVAPLPARPGDSALAKSPQLRRALLDSLGNESCDGLTDPGQRLPGNDGGLEIHRLDDHHVLVGSQCWLAAYNFGIGYWVSNDTPPFQPELVSTDATDYEDGQIGSTQKGRGIGDCIARQAWTWDGHGFVLTEDMTTGQCRGTPGGSWTLPTHVSDVR